MVVNQIEATSRCHSVQLVVRQLFSEVFARGAAGAVELIVGVIHLVAAHHGFEAAFVEGTVVRHERQALDKRLNLLSDVWKHGGIFGVLTRDAVNHSVPIQVVIRLRLDERIKRVHELAIANDDYADAAHAGALIVGGLEIYGGKGVHFLMYFSHKTLTFPAISSRSQSGDSTSISGVFESISCWKSNSGQRCNSKML